MILVDTTFVIDIMNGDKKAKQKQKLFVKGNQTIFVSTISVFELYIGVSKCGLPRKEEIKIKRALAKLVTIGFDERSAKEAGIIYVELKNSGTSIGGWDVLIAGIARAMGVPVLTRNTGHFNRISGLLVDSY